MITMKNCARKKNTINNPFVCMQVPQTTSTITTTTKNMQKNDIFERTAATRSVGNLPAPLVSADGGYKGIGKLLLIKVK